MAKARPSNEPPPNNPRGFAETVSIEAWRTPFDQTTGVADLHVDVVFGEGRIGSHKTPVHFRMRLTRAEVRLVRDGLSVLRFKPETLARAPMLSSEKSSTVKTKTRGRLAGALEATAQRVGVSFKASGSAERTHEDKMTSTVVVGAMEFQHRVIEDGYAFSITPTVGAVLKGQPWDPDLPRVSIRDSGHPRGRDEPPEPRVEVRCRREDLVIEDIHFTDREEGFFSRLDKAKQLAVEAYLRDQVLRLGVDVGDMSHPFTEILLADASPGNRPRDRKSD